MVGLRLTINLKEVVILSKKIDREIYILLFENNPVIPIVHLLFAKDKD